MSDAARVLSFQQPVDQWRERGLRLGERERDAYTLMWDIGDWWNEGHVYGERAAIVEGRDPHGPWRGPAFQTCVNCGNVAGKFGSNRRRLVLSFAHHAEVAPLPPDQADELLDWCSAADEPRTVQQLRIRKQQVRRAEREADLGAKLIAQADATKVYGVLYADPPWRLEPYSRETGLNRAADNHYPTMDLDAICGCLETFGVRVAKDAVLFLWATVPMLTEALEVMAEWGFAYKSHFVWLKDRPGTGYWNRNQHEVLLVGTRGDIPAPAPGTQYGSVIEAPTSVHSAKPMAFAEMIEEMFPTLPALELFARAPRLGWDVLGNEVETA